MTVSESSGGLWSFISALLKQIWLREPWWAEVWSAYVAITWALLAIFVSPVDEWAVFIPLTEVAPIAVWQTVVLLSGVAQMTFLVYNWRPGRWVCAFMLSIFYFFISLSFLTSPPLGLAIPLATSAYSGWAMANLYSMLRLIRGFR